MERAFLIAVAVTLTVAFLAATSERPGVVKARSWLREWLN